MKKSSFKRVLALVWLINAVIAASLALATVHVAPTAEIHQLDPEDKGLIFLAAAISVAGSCLASGIALKGVAMAGFAASTERPELTTYVLILGGLAEGIAIYGLLVAIMILGRA